MTQCAITKNNEWNTVCISAGLLRSSNAGAATQRILRVRACTHPYALHRLLYDDEDERDVIRLATRALEAVLAGLQLVCVCEW